MGDDCSEYNSSALVGFWFDDPKVMKIETNRLKILLFLFLAAVFLFSVNQFKESDSFYHLKVGQVIWETKTVPTHDIFSYTAPGAPWVTHEWLAELIFYGMYVAGGYWGEIVIVALLSVLTYYLAYKIAAASGVPVFLAALLTFAFGYLTMELWIGRPQIWSYLLVAALLYALEKYRRNGHKEWLVVSALLVLFWANVHASIPLGLAMIFGYFLLAICGRFLPRLFGPAGDWRYLFLLFVVAAGLSLVNPNTYHVLTYQNAIGGTAHTLQVLEWNSITDFWGKPETKVTIIEICASFIFAFWWFGWRRETRSWHALGMIVVAGVLPFLAIRHAGFWPMLAGPWIVIGLGSASKNILERYSAEKTEAVSILIFLVIAAAGVLRLPSGPVNQMLVPEKAVDFIQSVGPKGPEFNLYNEGGYLIWRLWPQEKVSIDGRSEVYTGESLENFRKIAYFQDKDWNKLVDDTYHVQYFVFGYYSPEFTKVLYRLVSRLAKNEWSLVYWDDAGVVFVRNTPEHQDLIRKYGIHMVSPWRAPQDIPPEARPAAALELRTVLERDIAAGASTRILEDYALQLLPKK